MIKQLFIGIYTEGPTDDRFLESITKRTIEEVAFTCPGDFDIELFPIKIQKSGLSFIEQVLEAIRTGVDEFGIMALCVHTDADYEDDSVAMENKIKPLLDEINTQGDEFCKVVIPIIPVYMSEAWMLADKNLLKNQIGTSKSDRELGINKDPETVADPKYLINEAIRIAIADLGKRRRRALFIKDLYLPIGQSIALDQLAALSSYRKFKKNVEQAFGDWHFLY